MGHVVHARDAHVDDVDAPGLGARRRRHFALDVAIRLRAWRQQLAHGAAVDLFLEGIAHHAVELHGAGAFIQPHVADVGLRVGDAPAHVPVDDHALLFGRQQRLGVGAVERQQALVDVATFWNGGGT
jgi:hypothetical protein